MHLKHLFVLIVMLLCPFMIQAADGQSPYTGLVYGDGTNTRQILDVFLPAALDVFRAGCNGQL